jgi:hypothetical protein
MGSGSPPEALIVKKTSQKHISSGRSESYAMACRRSRKGDRHGLPIERKTHRSHCEGGLARRTQTSSQVVPEKSQEEHRSPSGQFILSAGLNWNDQHGQNDGLAPDQNDFNAH